MQSTNQETVNFIHVQKLTTLVKIAEINRSQTRNVILRKLLNIHKSYF